MNKQQQPRRKRTAGRIICIAVVCIGVIVALLSPFSWFWGYLFIWGDGWSGTPFELFVSDQFPSIGVGLGLLLCGIGLVGLASMRGKRRTSSSQ
jgi:hypothetical protein